MKALFAVLAFCLFLSPLFAQEQNPCATDDAERELLEKHPEQLQYFEKLKQFTQEFAAQYPGHLSRNQRGGFIYVIPVVFHVVHNYGPENISDEQIYDQVEILNRDFRKRNADTASIVSAFQSIAADCEIEFRLATVDPDRNCTNGIDRIHSLQTYQGTNDSKLNPWPRDMYLNIWITAVVQQSSNTGGITLAYAYRPPSVEGLFGLYDGIVCNANCVGSIGTSNVSRSRTITHEVGHYFNLNHTWGNGPEPTVACGDDGINDTPITAGYWNCNLNGATCSHGTIIENVQNYMDYSTCPRMFTEGQKVAMQAALNSDVASRNNLWQEATLHFTGADVSTNINTCAPVADFNAPIKLACVGEPVNFTDFSWRGPITSWEWTFTNATPAVSIDENPSVVFNSPGWQTVSLKVSGALGQNEKVMDKYIYITDNAQTVTNPFREDFENPQQFADEWIVNNPDNNTTRWQISNAASYTGGYSLFLNNFQEKYDRDEVVTPPYDLLNTAATQLQFKYSYASKSGSGAEDVNDTLTIYYSLNCGKTWIQVYRQSGAALVTAGNYIYNFIPNRVDLWRDVTVALPPAATASTNVRFKFKFSNGGFANNVFIDNINIDDQYTSVQNSGKQVASLNVYPVPSSGKFNLELTAFESSEVQIQLFDMLGKNLSEQFRTLSSGTNVIPVEFNLETGIYTLSVSNKDERLLKKISIVR